MVIYSLVIRGIRNNADLIDSLDISDLKPMAIQKSRRFYQWPE
jgi:hypothetical protein